MELSDAQRAVVRIDESVFVRACPGAGKTRVAAAKVQREIGEAVRTGREIVCLTYTNAARDEIASRLEKLMSASWLTSARVRTLHGFLIESVLRPWRFRSAILRKDFQLAVPGSPKHEQVLQAVVGETHIDEGDLRRSVGSYWRDQDGIVHIDDYRSAVERFVELLEGSGAIDYQGVLFHGFELICDDSVANALRSSVSWLVVDEYQDFNPVALDIFSRLADGLLTKAFFIGDLGQMIYGFNGVTTTSLQETAERLCTRHEQLNETYRCGRRISDRASQLGLGVLRPVGRALQYDDAIISTQGGLVDVLRSFTAEVYRRGLRPSDVGVLAVRNRLVVAAARALSVLGEKAVVFTGRGKTGNGWLVDLAACVFVGCRDLTPQSMTLLQAKLYEAFETLGLADSVCCRFDEDFWLGALYDLRSQIDLRVPFREIAGLTMNSIFGNILVGRMLSPDDERVAKALARDEWKRLRADAPEILGATGDALAELVSPTDSIRCMTIHVSKGLEFPAVALVRCEEEILPFHDRHRGPEVEGGRRLFFVALTRAHQQFTATFQINPSRYLGEAGIILAS